MEIVIRVGQIILLELRVLEPAPPPSFVVVRQDGEDDDDEQKPGDMFGGK